MRPLVVIATVIAAMPGAVLGYDMAGIGGAIVLAVGIGVGGGNFGSLLAGTVTPCGTSGA